MNFIGSDGETLQLKESAINYDRNESIVSKFSYFLTEYFVSFCYNASAS